MFLDTISNHREIEIISPAGSPIYLKNAAVPMDHGGLGSLRWSRRPPISNSPLELNGYQTLESTLANA